VKHGKWTTVKLYQGRGGEITHDGKRVGRCETAVRVGGLDSGGGEGQWWECAD